MGLAGGVPVERTQVSQIQASKTTAGPVEVRDGVTLPSPNAYKYPWVDPI